MRIHYSLVLLTSLMFWTSRLHAQNTLSIDTFFNDNEKASVLKNKILTRVYLKYIECDNPEIRNERIQIPKTRYIEENFSDYEMVVDEKAFIPYKLNERAKLSLYNIFSAYSKLSGVQYYSRTDKKTQPLIIRCSRIESPTQRTLLNDIVNSNIAGARVNYFQFEDNRFGVLAFRSEIFNEGDNFIVKNVCVQPMEKFGFSINKKGEYQMHSFFIYDRKANGYFYYAFQAMRIRSYFIKKLGFLNPESFANRIRANTVHTAGLLGHDWRDRIKAFE